MSNSKTQSAKSANAGPYLFAKEKENFEDFSSGRFIYGHSGATNFPVRLINEIFLRSVNYLEAKRNSGPYTLYDPLCGIAYSLTVLGFLHPDKIKKLIGSDINTELLSTAEKNLSLLDQAGFQNRVQEIENLIQKFHKPSHQEALESATRLCKNPINHLERKTFQSNILDPLNLPTELNQLDLILADLPYGNLTNWSNTKTQNHSQILLNNLQNLLAKTSLIVLIADKKQIIEHQGFKKIANFKSGKRKILFLEKD